MDTVHECDRQTDRRTDRITITKTVLRIASHGKNSYSRVNAVNDGQRYGSGEADGRPQAY